MSGTTMMVAEHIKDYLAGKSIESTMEDMADITPDDLAKYDLVFAGSSTWDDGRYNDVSREFFEKLESSDVDLSSVKFGVFGLGDQFYPHFCTVVDLMKETLVSKKGNVFDEMIKIDGFPDDEVFSTVSSWVDKVVD